jgi:predicted nucleic acid-binding protein
VTNNQPDYSWDASVFIAWLINDATAPLDDIAEVVRQIDAKKANLVVSVMAYSEVLSAKHNEDQMARFRSFLKRSNVVVATNTIAIAEKAEQVRSRGLADGRKLKAPDATYIATAIIYGVDVLHSFDKDMLNVHESAVVDGLKITKPCDFSGQKSLPFQGGRQSPPSN